MPSATSLVKAPTLPLNFNPHLKKSATWNSIEPVPAPRSRTFAKAQKSIIDPYQKKILEHFSPITENLKNVSFSLSSIFSAAEPVPFDADFWHEVAGLQGLHHIHTEQALHVKQGNHWTPGTFVESFDPKFLPEKRVQFQLPYIMVKAKDVVTLGLGHIPEMMKKEHKGELYVCIPLHPATMKAPKKVIEAMQQQLPKGSYKLVKAENSPFIATPTSSYRSLVVALEKQATLGDTHKPITIKIGVDGTTWGNVGKKLWHEEVFSSIEASELFEKAMKSFDGKQGMQILKETAGIIPRYPDHMSLKDVFPLSMLVREFPFSNNKPQQSEVISMSALMSVLGGHEPLVHTLARNWLNRPENKNKTLVDYFKDQLIDHYINSAIHLLKHGISIEPHSQNLLVSVKNGSIENYIIRDGGGFSISRDCFGTKPLSADERKNMIYKSTVGSDLQLQNTPKRILEDLEEDASDKDKRAQGNLFYQHHTLFGYYVMQKLYNVFMPGSNFQTFSSQIPMRASYQHAAYDKTGHTILHTLPMSNLGFRTGVVTETNPLLATQKYKQFGTAEKKDPQFIGKDYRLKMTIAQMEELQDYVRNEYNEKLLEAFPHLKDDKDYVNKLYNSPPTDEENYTGKPIPTPSI
ncbi:MAG: hypothetical protein CMD81_02375 [Gammaproteobacteria bacterium]|nr:hypothetical protein [Gammaproteobacteria bacterium]HBF08760.1 hypothetical protein [Gammaproteobacteria bacterium]|tara:strand:+ start:208 stop:2109 length:1902 start_codon:yes stop_codon:yes gene_type:complete